MSHQKAHQIARQSHQVLVLGGGYAGVMSANRLCAHLPGAQVTLIDDTGTFAHRIRLHEFGAGRGLKAPSLRRYLHPKVSLKVARVEIIDGPGGEVLVEGAEGGRESVSFDGLVYALGSGYGGVSFPGLFTHAFPLGHWSGASHIRQALAGGAKRVVVIGGGLTALEGATEIAAFNPDVEVCIVSAGSIDEGLSPKGSRYLRARLGELGIRCLEGRRALGAEGEGVSLDEGERLPSDCTVWAGGGAASPLARSSGLPVDGAGRVRVDGALRAYGHDNIVAVGDGAAALDAGGRALAMTCNAALPMGAHGAQTLARHLRGEAPGDFDFAWVLRCISLGRGRGLAQMLNPDGTARDSVMTGRAGALVKSMILGMVPFFLSMEAKTGWPLYQWAHLPDSSALGAPADEARHG